MMMSFTTMIMKRFLRRTKWVLLVLLSSKGRSLLWRVIAVQESRLSRLHASSNINMFILSMIISSKS